MIFSALNKYLKDDNNPDLLSQTCAIKRAGVQSSHSTAVPNKGPLCLPESYRFKNRNYYRREKAPIARLDVLKSNTDIPVFLIS